MLKFILDVQMFSLQLTVTSRRSWRVVAWWRLWPQHWACQWQNLPERLGITQMTGLATTATEWKNMVGFCRNMAWKRFVFDMDNFFKYEHSNFALSQQQIPYNIYQFSWRKRFFQEKQKTSKRRRTPGGDPQHPGCTRKIEYDGYGPMVVTGTDGNPGCLGPGKVTRLKGRDLGVNHRVRFGKFRFLAFQGISKDTGIPGVFKMLIFTHIPTSEL